MQLDMEMSFLDRDEVMSLMEQLIATVFKEVGGRVGGWVVPAGRAGRWPNPSLAHSLFLSCWVLEPVLKPGGALASPSSLSLAPRMPQDSSRPAFRAGGVAQRGRALPRPALAAAFSCSGAATHS